MTTGQATDNHLKQLSLGLSDAHVSAVVKCPKVVVLGVAELGLKASLSLHDPEGEEKPINKRLSVSLTVKDVLLRGKFELQPAERKLHYSKKFRLPYLNTELLRVRLTTQLPGGPAASKSTSGGLLGSNLLGVTVSLSTDHLHQRSIVRKAPEYSMQIQPRLGLPQSVYSKLGMPGSIYVKADTTLHLSDAASAKDVTARLDVHSARLVVRLYDASRVKPCLAGRNLAAAARRLTDRDFADDVAKSDRLTREVVEAEVEPDVIDKAAAKAREWAHAVLVNTCIATRHLQEHAVAAGEWLQGKAKTA